MDLLCRAYGRGHRLRDHDHDRRALVRRVVVSVDGRDHLHVCGRSRGLHGSRCGWTYVSAFKPGNQSGLFGENRWSILIVEKQVVAKIGNAVAVLPNLVLDTQKEPDQRH